MARARNIKPSFFTNEQLADNCPLGRLLFIGLWTQADFKGEIEWKSRTLKIQILPWDECDIDQLAINLDKSGLIRFYSDGDKVFINIPNFGLHQNPHKNERDKGSLIPVYSEARRQLIDLSTLTINPDKSGAEPDESDSDRADSLFLNPDSLIPDSGIPHSDAETPSSGPEPKSKRFAKPSLDELITEFNGRVLHPENEANKFINHYESVGWKVGKNPMKSWKHSVTNWIARINENANSNQHPEQQLRQSGRLSTVDKNGEAARIYLAQHGASTG